MNARTGLASTDTSDAMDSPAQANHDQAVTGNGAEYPRKVNALAAEFIG